MNIPQIVVKFVFKMTELVGETVLPVIDDHEDVDWREELALANAQKLIRVLSNEEFLPCPTINRLMENAIKVLETDFYSSLVVSNVDRPILDIVVRDDVPSLLKLVVPYQFHELSDLDFIATDLVGDLVEATSRFVDRGRRNDWAKSRRRKFDSVVGENPINVQGIFN